MPKGEDRVGQTVVAFVTGMLLVAVIWAILGPSTESVRESVREEVHAEYMAEKTIRENDIALEDMKWSIKRIDGELEDIQDRLDKSWNDFVNEPRVDMND